MSLSSEKEATKIMVAAKQSALKRISEILKHPDDLNTKLTRTKQKIYIEKASIDAQMKSLVQSQLDDSQRGLEMLDISKKETAVIKNNLESIDSLCIDSQGMIENFEEIKKVSKTRRNFLETKNIVERFLHLDEKLDEIQELLDNETKVVDRATKNILFIHFKLMELSAFQDSVMFKAQTLTSDERLTLVNYFSRLNRLNQSFEEYLMILVDNIYEILMGSNVDSIIYIIKLIEAEEKLDEHLQKENLNILRERHGYREKFFGHLSKVIEKRFDSQLKFDNDTDDSVKYLNYTGFVIDDLTIVHDEFIPRFPKKYKIFNFFMLEYHRHVKALLDKIIETASDAGAILMILRWVQEYYTDMSTRLGVTEDSLEPQLLDGNENKLIENYLALNHTKSVEWVTNIMTTGTKRFSEREEQPEVNLNGNYNLSLSVILFQMINQQINVAKTSNRTELSYNVLLECKKTMELFQSGWKATINQEYNFFVNSPETSPKGLPEYIIALANDCLSCSEYTEEIIKEVSPIFNESDMEKITNEMDSVLKGFMDISKRCITILIEIIMFDLKSTFSQMFTSAWYDEKLINLIIGTLIDYCDDFQVYLQEYLFTKFITDLNDRFIIAYLESFCNKNAKFKMPQCVEKMKNDIAQAVEFFTKYRTSKRVNESFKHVNQFISMITSSVTMLFLDYYSLWKECPDISISYIETVLNKRDDIQHNQLREIIDQCSQKSKEDSSKLENKDLKTIFSRINV